MNAPATTLPDQTLVNYTHVMYGLHALSAVIGIFGAATVVGSFIFGIPSIVAVVMNYVRRSDARGTYLESHFSWQLRTFWYAALWSVVAFLLSGPLMLILVGFLTYALAIVAIGVWIIYRVARGWLRLKEAQAI
ncbi:MAG TPA: hypothetical protein VNS57_15155 [Steroidobacteraceae bacterium]|nr:hypothetical protein [Steroidobacteraceae bacterium]